MRRLVIATLAAAALTCSPPAHADPESDYLAILSDTPGFTVNGFTGPMLTGAGQQACGHLRDGMSFDDTVNAMMWYPGATNAAIKAMVRTAQQTLCPDVPKP